LVTPTHCCDQDFSVGREGEGQRNGPKTGDNRTAPTHPPRATSTTRREPEQGERPRKPGQRAEHEGEERRHERAAEGPARGARRTAPNTEHGRAPKEPTHPPGTPAGQREEPAVRADRPEGRPEGRHTGAHVRLGGAEAGGRRVRWRSAGYGAVSGAVGELGGGWRATTRRCVQGPTGTDGRRRALARIA
jgi:hypothetical protein